MLSGARGGGRGPRARGQGNIMCVETVLCHDYGGSNCIYLPKFITQYIKLGNFIMLCLTGW